MGAAPETVRSIFLKNEAVAKAGADPVVGLRVVRLLASDGLAQALLGESAENAQSMAQGLGRLAGVLDSSEALEQVAAGALAASDYEDIDHFAEPRFDELAGTGSLEHALATLSGPEREAISLRYGAELTLPEIAKLTGEPLTTVESRVRRALEKLRDALS